MTSGFDKLKYLNKKGIIVGSAGDPKTFWGSIEDQYNMLKRNEELLNHTLKSESILPEVKEKDSLIDKDLVKDFLKNRF